MTKYFLSEVLFWIDTAESGQFLHFEPQDFRIWVPDALFQACTRHCINRSPLGIPINFLQKLESYDIYPISTLLTCPLIVDLQYSILLFVQQESSVFGINRFSPRSCSSCATKPSTIPNPNATSIFSRTGDANESQGIIYRRPGLKCRPWYAPEGRFESSIRISTIHALAVSHS